METAFGIFVGMMLVVGFLFVMAGESGKQLREMYPCTGYECPLPLP